MKNSKKIKMIPRKKPVREQLYVLSRLTGGAWYLLTLLVLGLLLLLCVISH